MAFASFSLVSLKSKRRSQLYLGSVIVTLIQAMVLYRLFGWLFGFHTFNFGYMLCSLFVTCLFIIYDT